MSVALHLAPLVEQGLIAKPIDIYEKSSPSDIHPHNSGSYDENFHPGSGTSGREVGIGIWSTALEPFVRNNKASDSHLDLIKDLQHKGQYVDKVGYRIPSGKWLTRGKLNTSSLYRHSSSTKVTSNSISNSNNDDDHSHDPALLFIREKDFLSSLQKACKVEEENGTICIHHNTHVEDVVLPKNINSTNDANMGCLKVKGEEEMRTKQYHFIIAAEGMNSSLRVKYAGYATLEKRWKQMKQAAKLSEQWEKQVLEEQNGIEDREYTVFRGNSPLSDSEANMDGVSFQTWGEGKSMRFAAVGMSHPKSCIDGEDDLITSSPERIEKQVWFATIRDTELTGVKDPEERKKLLVDAFKSWHDPVGRLIDSTPSEEIIMERGVAHKHSVFPVFNLSQVIHYQQQMAMKMSDVSMHYSRDFSGPGPILLFTGDAAMTVDPVLAQGFTIAMEAAADLAETLEISLSTNNTIFQKDLPFDPTQLREALGERNQRRYERMLCLLRATDLVQAISQPSDSISGFLSNNLVRPSIMLIPSVVKEAVFSYVMKYSLGLYGSNYAIYNKSMCDITKATKVDTR